MRFVVASEDATGSELPQDIKLSLATLILSRVQPIMHRSAQKTVLPSHTGH